MPLVGARLHGGVKDAAACTSHLGIVGVDLDLHFTHRFDVWDEHRSIPKVRDRDAVHQVIVSPHGAAAKRQQRRIRLILLAYVKRVAVVDYRRHDQRGHVRISPGIRQRAQKIIRKRSPSAGGCCFQQWSVSGDLHLFGHRARLQADIEVDELLGPDIDARTLEGLEAL